MNLDYEWPKDFPISLQKSSPEGKTEFTLEFELTDQEKAEFTKKVKVSLTTNLKAKVTIGKEQKNVEFIVSGKAKKTFNKKIDEISSFIDSKLLIQYIPAIRTSDLAIKIVDNLLSIELSNLEDNPEFKKIITEIKKLQKPILEKISKSISNTISSFIPDVKSVKVENREQISNILSSACKVYINDGIETDLQSKGDGVISLTAISLLRHISQVSFKEKKLILLLEEPESHLHPQAIHRLKSVLSDISTINQVICTTHSPIIVEKGIVSNNIIVQKNKATQAKSIAEIRDSLGITMSDNLSSAYLVLLVEGSEDKLILTKWLQLKSSELKSAIEKGILIIDHLGGATNVSYKATHYKSTLCNVYAFLDNDKAGRASIDTALEKGTIKDNEYTLCNCIGMANSELEDLYLIESYKAFVIENFGVDLSHKIFKTNKNAWSERVRSVFLANGKTWTERIELKLKESITNHILTQGLEVINPHKINTIDTLIANLKIVLSKR